MFLILFLNSDVEHKLKHTQVSAPDFLCDSAGVPFWLSWSYGSLVGWDRKCWQCASAVTVSHLVICVEDLARV